MRQAASATRSMSSALATSATTYVAVPPVASMSRTTCSSAPPLRATSTTRAPRAAAMRAVVSPIPREAPVTTITCSSIFCSRPSAMPRPRP